ncbi:lactase/phlorizin hydrolase-like [Mytilus californianus]|uniref:lactase/phlorizin hydrolase-like n=1 Tax=Mytilus californianus TaxID=6549 RepID=UPI0022461B78|nr:lactase/phlorizin hydrolase-like [Mytilus californianus]
MLNWIKKEYNNPKVIITENGITDNNGTTNDPHRIYYYRQYINQLLKAVKQDECNVIGYTAWCLLDTFEWNRGFHEKFGLHSTDFSDPTRPRTPKLSAAAYTEIVNRNGFPPSSGSSDAQNFIMLILLSVSFYCILKE